MRSRGEERQEETFPEKGEESIVRSNLTTLFLPKEVGWKKIRASRPRSPSKGVKKETGRENRKREEESQTRRSSVRSRSLALPKAERHSKHLQTGSEESPLMMKIKQRGSSRAGLEEKGCFVSDPPRRGFFLEDRGERCGRKVEDRKERRGEEEEKKRGWKEEETMNKSLEAREEEPPSLLATSFTKTRPPHRVPLPPSSPTAPRSRNEKEREKMFPPSHKRSSLSSLSPRARAVPPHLPFLLRRRTGEGVRKEHPRGRKERVDIRVGREKEGKGERERGEKERKREKKRRKRFPAAGPDQLDAGDEQICLG